jgi:hypothetical protein
LKKKGLCFATMDAHPAYREKIQVLKLKADVCAGPVKRSGDASGVCAGTANVIDPRARLAEQPEGLSTLPSAGASIIESWAVGETKDIQRR